MRTRTCSNAVFALVMAAAAVGCGAHGDTDKVIIIDNTPDGAAESGPEASPDTKPPPDATPPEAAAEAEAGADATDAGDKDAADAADSSEAAPDVTCPSGYKSCGGSCVKADDPGYGCGLSGCDPCAVAHATSVCSNNACTIGSCDANYADCNTNPADGCEVDLLTSTQNCGACGESCNLANAIAACTNGTCTIVSCNSGFKNCDPSTDNGCETNINLDTSHCGDCGHLCTPVGSSGCVNGVCQFTGCPTGKGNCDNDPDNGCETDLTSTLAHCGACNNACSLPNATASCVTSTCQVVACNSGFSNCDGQHANGCEVDIATNILACGACFSPCSTINSPSRACASGVCNHVCATGFADCNGPKPGGMTDDGCETWIAGDVLHCGGCGTACSNAHGSVACASGVCAPACDAGWKDCNSIPADGCETSIWSTSNCGTCGVTCANQHGSITCPAGACVPVCDTGWSDCDTNPNNGCEASTLADPNNCGGCGKVCATDAGTTANTCSAAACHPVCASGYADCDGNPANGCETSTATSYDNCGTCGHSCAAPFSTTVCSAGACAIVGCNTQYYDIDKNAATGCEYKCPYLVPGLETCDGTDEDCDGQIDETYDKQNDPNNCGTCGNTCGSSTGGLCCAGVCKISDATNCGACGHTCTQGMLVINEMMIDPAKVGDTLGEWFELYNPGTFAIDIRGFKLTDLNPTPDSHTVNSLTPVIVPAGGLLVLGNNATKLTNGGVDVAYQYSSFDLGNSSDEVIITAFGVEIDRVEYPTDFDVSGKSLELSLNHRTYLLNNNTANWCQATATYGLGDFGTPNLPNSCSK